ncbi:MAG: phosphate acyltransferase [Planctomycetes bacterium]|nr:phosphate acyltransferase [Planctomycetota bacterium]
MSDPCQEPDLRPERVTVLDAPGAEGAEALAAAFARAALEPLALALPEREQAAVVVLCRGLASPCAAFVLRRPARDGEQDPVELARHLALETARPVVVAEQAARARNAAAVLAALAGVEAEAARDDLSAPQGQGPRRVGLRGRAADLAPVLRAAGLAAEQVVVLEDAAEDPAARPPGDVAAVLGRPPAEARPEPPPPPDVVVDPDGVDPDGVDADVTGADPDAASGPDAGDDAPARAAWVEADVDLVLPWLVRAAVDHARGPALLDDEACGALARALAGLALHGRLPAAEDPRLLVTLAPAAAVALEEAAGRARPAEGEAPVEGEAPAPARLGPAVDAAAYAEALADLRSPLRRALRPALDAARATPRRLVFSDGDDARVVRAARALADAGLAVPWLLGDLFRLETRAREQGVSLKGIRVLDPARDKRRATFGEALGRRLGPGALSPDEAARRAEAPAAFAALAVLQGEADAALLTDARVDGLEALDLAPDLLGRRGEHTHLAGAHLVAVGGRVLVVSDTAGASDPTSEEVADAALQAAWLARHLLARAPRVALLSYTAAGPTAGRDDPSVRRLALARDVARARAPDLEVEGPTTIEAVLAAPAEDDVAQVLVVADRAAGATLVGALRALAGAEALGPLAPALGRPVTVAPRGAAATVDDLVLLGALTCALASAPAKAEGDDAPSRAYRTTGRLGATTPAPPVTRDAAKREDVGSGPAPKREDAGRGAPETTRADAGPAPEPKRADAGPGAEPKRADAEPKRADAEPRRADAGRSAPQPKREEPPRGGPPTADPRRDEAPARQAAPARPGRPSARRWAGRPPRPGARRRPPVRSSAPTRRDAPPASPRRPRTSASLRRRARRRARRPVGRRREGSEPGCATPTAPTSAAAASSSCSTATRCASASSAPTSPCSCSPSAAAAGASPCRPTSSSTSAPTSGRSC